MRVITGTARGKPLKTLAGESVRPTSDRVKEALFSIIQFDVSERRVLDLFAGSGQLGIEALSQGASGAVFADRDRASIAVAKRNAEDCGFMEVSSFIRTDSLSFLRNTTEKFSLVFLDPPYSKQEAGGRRQENGLSLLEEALELLPRVLTEDAVVCAESPLQQSLPAVLGKLTAKEYRYGKIKLTIYR